MRVVSIGDLVLDYYYKNGKLIGVDGGMSSHNIIANLAKKKISTAVYGVSGNDIQGKIANLSLKKLNVDVSKVLIKDNIKTRCFHVSYDEEGFISKKRCPKCNEKKWYEESQIDIEYITKNIQNDDILVFDNLNDKNIEIIKNVSNKKIIDIGQYFEFENLSKEDIINKLNNDFEIINFNERVSNYLLDKLNLKNNIELYNLLKAKLVTITRGENGAIFIYNSKEYKFNLKDNGNVIDSSGAGDAFLSSIIFDYIKNSYEFNEELFPKWYEKSIKLTSKVVSNFGARGHLKSLYKIKKIDKVCTCENFEYNERRKIKRCNININNLESRVINAINSNAYDKLLDINKMLDKLVEFYEKNGLEMYTNELEYIYVRYMLATYIKRLAKAKDKKKFNQGAKWARTKVKEKFPNYKLNIYLTGLGKGFYLKYFNKLFADLIYYLEKNKMN